jgi:hypothetical protein
MIGGPEIILHQQRSAAAVDIFKTLFVSKKFYIEI